MEKLLSIIIPVYNNEKSIRKLLESLVNLKSQEIEIIIIDDGSTDNSLNMCLEYTKLDDRIIVKHKSNEGVSAARNEGISISNGKFVYFCDSDDVIFTSVLDEAINYFELDADVYFFDYYFKFADKKTIVKSSFILDANILLKKDYIIDNVIKPLILKESTDMASIWHKFFKKTVIDINNIMFEDKVYKGEDWRFVLDYLAVAETAFYIPKVIYEYSIDCCQNNNKYKIAVGCVALGSIKRKVSFNERFNLGADRNQLLIWYCAAIEQVIISIKQGCTQQTVLAMVKEPIIDKAAFVINHTKGDKLIEIEISRKYKLYSLLLEKKMYRSFFVLCKVLENI